MYTEYVEDPFLTFLYLNHRELYPVAQLFGADKLKHEYIKEYNQWLFKAGTAVYSYARKFDDDPTTCADITIKGGDNEMD